MAVDRIIAVDPGREKCGLAVVDAKRKIWKRQIIAAENLADTVRVLAQEYGTAVVALGSRTASKEIHRLLQGMPTGAGVIDVTVVEEHRSTEEARQRYWRENPPQGIWRLIPLGMRVPPEPVDDWVAVILAERYFASKKQAEILQD